MTTADVVTRFKDVKRSGDGWAARCPAHDDNRNSLAISSGADGKTVLYCHVKCSTEQIVTAAGLKMSDLFADSGTRPASGGANIVCTYDYTDENGKLLSQVVRYAPKDFRQRVPNGKGGWEYKLTGVRRVLFRLPDVVAAVAAQRFVFITEGEKDAIALSACELRGKKLVATSAAGGAKAPWQSSYTATLRGARVVILPDNDDPGREHARKVARALWGAAKEIRIIDLPGLPPKGDVSNWFEAGHTADELAALIQGTPPLAAAPEEPVDVPPAGIAGTIGPQVEESPDAWEPAAPLRNMTVPSFPTETLTPWLREFVEAVAEATQTPVDLAGMTGLAVLATCAAGVYEVSPCDGWCEPLNLWTAPALDPGNRKTAVFRDLTQPISDFEAELIAAAKVEVGIARSRRRTKEHMLAKAERDASQGKPDERMRAESEAARLAAELEETPEPVIPRLIADDVTPEAAASLLAEQRGCIAILSAEGGVFDIMAGRYSGGGAPNLDVFLKGHAGDALRIDRKGRAAEVVQHPALTLGLVVQPDVLRGMIEKPSFRGRGLLGRFLYSMPESKLGRRNTAPPPVPETVRYEYRNAVRALLSQRSAAWAGPSLIRFSTSAWTELAAFQQWLEPQLAPDGTLGTMNDWAGKLGGAVVRIAGLLHLADHQNGDVRASTVVRAIEIGKYLIPHARAAYLEMGGDPAVAQAEIVLRWIKRSGQATLTRRDIFEGTKGRFQRVNALDPIIAILTEHGYLREIPMPMRAGPGRRPSPTYEVNPCVSAVAKYPPESHNPTPTALSESLAKSATAPFTADALFGEAA